jgi:hypothetical protein
LTLPRRAVDDINHVVARVNHVVARVLDQLNIAAPFAKRWT